MIAEDISLFKDYPIRTKLETSHTETVTSKWADLIKGKRRRYATRYPKTVAAVAGECSSESVSDLKRMLTEASSKEDT